MTQYSSIDIEMAGKTTTVDAANPVGNCSPLRCVCSVTCVAAQFAEWLGDPGSQAGPANSSDPFGIALLLTPSLLLAPSFVVMTASDCHVASEKCRVFSIVEVFFATIHAALFEFSLHAIHCRLRVSP